MRLNHAVLPTYFYDAKGVEIPLGIQYKIEITPQNIDNGEDVKVYPTTISNEVFIWSEMPQSLNDVNIQLVNLSGNIVFETTNALVKGTTRLESAQIENLNSGFYILRLNHSSGLNKNFKIFKN